MRLTFRLARDVEDSAFDFRSSCRVRVFSDRKLIFHFVFSSHVYQWAANRWEIHTSTGGQHFHGLAYYPRESSNTPSLFMLGVV